jgi:exosortase/archaeosortase
MFGGFPVSEIAIFAGLVALIVWMVRGGTPVLVVGLVLSTLGVVEVTAREHFSGYRSHTTLLAAIPAVAIAIGLLTAFGAHSGRAALMVLVAVPIFSVLFWFLRTRFLIARQARVARLPEP